jgi:hypothetical protein
MAVSMYPRVVDTVRGEKLGLACSSHARDSSSNVPLAAALGVNRSASMMSAARALEASR